MWFVRLPSEAGTKYGKQSKCAACNSHGVHIGQTDSFPEGMKMCSGAVEVYVVIELLQSSYMNKRVNNVKHKNIK